MSAHAWLGWRTDTSTALTQVGCLYRQLGMQPTGEAVSEVASGAA